MAGYRESRTWGRVPSTGLSVGLAVFAVLRDRGIQAFPVVAMPSAAAGGVQLPYVVYSLSGMSTRADKAMPGPRSVSVVLACYGADYDAALEQAEVVNGLMHGVTDSSVWPAVYSGLEVRGIQLEDASDGYDGDAYYVSLTYKILTN